MQDCKTKQMTRVTTLVTWKTMNGNLVRITDTKSTNNVHKVWYTSPKRDNVISADKHNQRGIVFNEHSTIITGQWDLSFQCEILYTYIDVGKMDH